MEILLLGQMKDLQTGLYIVKSIEELGHMAGYVDIRAIVEKKGLLEAQNDIVKQASDLEMNPDIVMVLKGLELTLDTLNKLKELYPNAKFVNWFFDVYLSDKRIWENEKFDSVIKFYDYFMCSLKGVADKLQRFGFKNAIHVGEACYPPLHGEQYMNNFQKQKYGSDVAFIGSVGMVSIHNNRVEFLTKIAKEGFDLKVWGSQVGADRKISPELRECMTNVSVINETHSQVCQSSLINIGIDQDTTLEQSWSARLYRVMCAGGLYLTTPTKGIHRIFKTNGKDEEITKDQELVVFYSDDDLVKKLDFLLEHDNIREAIAKNGQKKVLEEHTFSDRLKQIIEVCKK